MNENGASAWVEITLDTTARLDAPTGLTMIGYDATTEKATLAWVDHADGELRYEVQSSTDGGKTRRNLSALSADATSRACSALHAGSTYIYRLRAVSETKTSEWASIMFYAPEPTSSALLASEIFADPFDDFDFFEEEWKVKF